MPNAAPWTPEEDVYLCHANTNASEDGDTSTDQSSALFWDCISDAFAQQAGSEILKSTENELENANNFEDDISEDDAFDADDFSRAGIAEEIASYLFYDSRRQYLTPQTGAEITEWITKNSEPKSKSSQGQTTAIRLRSSPRIPTNADQIDRRRGIHHNLKQIDIS
ncbi:hypothetical protein PPTG_22818 [Phytophthora nicotianae INRA-310]|uniref:Uncharacterized protein n=1 Tax=Phytophthora nicotianae (strain INRA-310) TaxID=761204 RepID=W2Q952_PHYN3|nr:hypothetical protein PPTG_22818 [Phytophthora nicotianae INRA-310]ETN09692.1 hypothetical protein PPTG_22818 [Phytophthora nicotianae INRA-310]